MEHASRLVADDRVPAVGHNLQDGVGDVLEATRPSVVVTEKNNVAGLRLSIEVRTELVSTILKGRGSGIDGALRLKLSAGGWGGAKGNGQQGQGQEWPAGEGACRGSG